MTCPQRLGLSVGLVVFAGVVFAGCSKPSADEHAARGDEYLSQQRVQEAIIEYRNAIQIDPQRGDVRTKLAEAHLQNRNGSEALREFVRAADLLPNDATAQIKAGSLLLLAGAFEDAQSRANQALSLDPKNTDAMILLANSKAGLKNLDGALTEYQEAAALNPTDRVYAGMATIQLAKGDRVGAEANFRKAVELAPQSIDARLALASFLWSSQRQNEAEAELKASLAIEPTNLLANRALGVFYLISGRAAEAEVHFKTIADSEQTTPATLALSDYYVLTKRYDDARKVLQSLTSDEKAWAEAMTRLAAVDAIEGLRARGVERLHEVIGKFPDDSPARLLRARLRMVDGKFDEALEDASHIVQVEQNTPAAGHAYMLIGYCHASLDRRELAVKAFEDALAKSKQTFEPALALASLYITAGNLDRANTYAQQALTAQPAHPAARAMRIRLLLLQRKSAEAQTELATLSKEFPNAPAVLNLIAAQQLTQRQFAAARRSYTKVTQMLPHDVEALTGLVQLDILEGRSSVALERVEAALQANAGSADLHILAARMHGAAGQWQSVEDLLKKAIDLEPSRLRGYGMLAQLYIQQNRLPEAERQFQTMVEKNPTSVAINTMLGMLYDMRGKLDEAEQQYERVLALDREAAVAANNLAYRWADTNRNLDQALQLAQTAQRRLPDEPNVADTLGWVYYRKGMSSAAIRELEIAVKASANDPLMRYHLGMSYNQAGEFQKAREALKAALSMSDSFPGADEAKKTLASLGG